MGVFFQPPWVSSALPIWLGLIVMTLQLIPLIDEYRQSTELALPRQNKV